MRLPDVRFTLRLMALVAVIALAITAGRGMRLHPRVSRGGNLPGSQLKVEQATKQADLVVVARLLKLVGGFSDETVTFREGVVAKGSAVLKGNWDRSQPVNVAILFLNKEKQPKTGQEYIMFAQRTGGTSTAKKASRGFQIIKLLDKTSENLEAVNYWIR